MSDGPRPHRVPPVLRRAAALAGVVVLAGGCEVLVGEREACGERRAGGGPPAIVTRDQELCDVVRLRVLRVFDVPGAFSRANADTLLDRTRAWERRATVDELIAAVERDAGAQFAAEVRRAVNSVRAASALPLPPECGESERCLVKGAAKGFRIALLTAVPSAGSEPPN